MDDTSQALQRIAKGTGIIFAGTIISMLFGFFSRVLIARYFSVGEYGVFNLALTILSIALVVATLGFQSSLPREVAYFREKERSRVKDLISTAFIIVAVNSVIWVAVLILGAESISKIFGDERLIYALRVIAFALPFSALTAVMTAVSRGFGRVKEHVYFQNVIYPTVFLVFIAAVALLKLPFAYVFLAYVFAWSLTLLALILSMQRVGFFELRMSLNMKLGKELVRFSIPLMLTGISVLVMTWTDTLMLGYYKSSEVVGLYNSAAPTARLLSIISGSAGLIFPPLATTLYARKKIDEFMRVYQILTKWIFLATLPLFILIFLFPEATINFFFGSKYVSATSALRILAVGFMFHTLLGLNGLSLIVIKEGRFLMCSTLFSAGINVFLNALLIPNYDIEGAAVATAIAYFVANVLNFLRLYQKTRIHPFSRNYTKILISGIVFLGLVDILNLRTLEILYAFVITVVFTGIYLLIVLFSRSVDREDVELLLMVEKKLGINLDTVKKFLKMFV